MDEERIIIYLELNISINGFTIRSIRPKIKRKRNIGIKGIKQISKKNYLRIQRYMGFLVAIAVR